MMLVEGIPSKSDPDFGHTNPPLSEESNFMRMSVYRQEKKRTQNARIQSVLRSYLHWHLPITVRTKQYSS